MLCTHVQRIQNEIRAHSTRYITALYMLQQRNKMQDTEISAVLQALHFKRWKAYSVESAEP